MTLIVGVAACGSTANRKLEAANEELKRQLAEAQEDNARLARVVEALRLESQWDFRGPRFQPRPQGSPGVVKKVRDNFVSISVGSGDGVKIGDNYGVRRGATYVGRIRITRVDKNMAVGEFDDQFKGPGVPPQAGDIAEPEPG
ncbi:MAG: hypothetical protein ACYTGN_03100 [Planctomycetota bacterium]